MPDCVLDATIIHLSNGNLAGRRAGNALDRRLSVIEGAATGVRRLRYNPKLLEEYRKVAKVIRNDLIELFFAALESVVQYWLREINSRGSYMRERPRTADGLAMINICSPLPSAGQTQPST